MMKCDVRNAQTAAKREPHTSCTGVIGTENDTNLTTRLDHPWACSTVQVEVWILTKTSSLRNFGNVPTEEPAITILQKILYKHMHQFKFQILYTSNT
jgi:hypothetical protein